MSYDTNELKKAIHDLELSVDAAGRKTEVALIDLYKVLREINRSLQDIAEAVRDRPAP